GGRGVLLVARPRRGGSRKPSGELRGPDAGGRLCRVQSALRSVPQGGPIVEAACWAHARRKFFDLARLQKAPIAIAAVERIDALFTRFLADGRLCISNNAAERALRAIAVGRHNWTFTGSDEGARRAAAVSRLIGTAKLNGIDPQAWLADVLARLPDHPMRRVGELLPWQWCGSRRQAA